VGSKPQTGPIRATERPDFSIRPACPAPSAPRLWIRSAHEQQRFPLEPRLSCVNPELPVPPGLLSPAVCSLQTLRRSILQSIIPPDFAASPIQPRDSWKRCPPTKRSVPCPWARCSRQSATLNRSLPGCRLLRPAKTAAPAGLRIPSFRACGPLLPRPRSPHFSREVGPSAAPPSFLRSIRPAPGSQKFWARGNTNLLRPSLPSANFPFLGSPPPHLPSIPKVLLVVAGLISLHVEISGFR
jgi:hypothetical protein